MNDNQKKIGIGIVVAILCAVAFYFLYWTKTPVYSLNIIREAIEKHDVDTFERHVDLDTLFDKGFDDVLVATDRIEGKNSLEDPLVAGMVQMLKKPAVAALKARTLDAVKGEFDEEGKERKNGSGDKFADNLEKEAGVNQAVFKDASVVSKEGNEAIVALKFYNKQLDKDFTVKLKMAKLEDGTWKVKQMTNLVDFLVEADKAVKAKLAELNKPIREDLEKAVKVSDVELDLENDGNPFFASHWLEYYMSVTNETDKDIADLYIKNSVVGADGTVRRAKVLKYNQGLPAHETTRLIYEDSLNHFIADEKQMMDHPEGLTLKAEIVGIKYTDGSKIEILQKLPDPQEEKKK